jgi:hypothetical protein
MNLEKRVEINLTLPEADIDGLYFNEQKVHAIFEKKKDGWWQSRVILLMSARNVKDDNNRDILTEYLNDDRIKKQLAKKFNVPPEAITVALPKKSQGIKQYHGVDCWYWLAYPYEGSATYFRHVYHDGEASYNLASNVGGCAPAFCVGNEVTL